MRVLFLYDGEYPWDIRVEKICNTFLKQNHEVHMVCRNKSGKIRNEIYKGINIHRILSLPSFFGKLNDALTFPAFFSPIWLIEIYRQAKNNSCDLIVVRDLPMAMAAVWIGKLRKLPIILDMAECYPEMLRCIWKFSKLKVRNIFLRNPFFADILEKIVLNKIDAVMVMVEESAKRLTKLGVDPKKIYIVSNTPEVDRFQQDTGEPDQGDIVKLLYVGLLSASRGVDTCIKAVRKYIDMRGHKITFSIAGTGNFQSELKKLVTDLGLQNDIKFLGWVDNKVVPSLIRDNNVCVVPHLACSHWNNTIPNKLFDYMAASRAVIVSDVLPMKRIVEETKAGAVYNNGDIDDLVEKLILLENSTIRIDYGKNGREAIVNKYNWQNEIQAVDCMLKNVMEK